MNRLGRVMLLVGGFALAAMTGCKEEPKPAEVHKDKGNELLEAGKYVDAAKEFEASLQADPAQTKLWEKVAYCYKLGGDLDKAVDAIQHTLPPTADTAAKAAMLKNIAGMYLQAGNGPKAEQYFSEMVKLNPQDDYALSWLEEIHMQRGGAKDAKVKANLAELETALDFAEKVIALKPNVINAYVNKRVIFAKYNDYWKKEMEAAQDEAKANRKDKAKAKEAMERATQAEAKMNEYKQKYDDMSGKIKEVVEANKAAAAAAAKSGQPAPGAPAAPGAQPAPGASSPEAQPAPK